jgi:hypothetical protein
VLGMAYFYVSTCRGLVDKPVKDPSDLAQLKDAFSGVRQGRGMIVLARPRSPARGWRRRVPPRLHRVAEVRHAAVRDDRRGRASPSTLGDGTRMGSCVSYAILVVGP